VADVAQDVWSIGIMFFVLLTQYFPWDHPLPSAAKDSAFVSKDIRSSIVVVACTSLVQVCCSPSTAHLLSLQFLHERVFVSQQKRCTVSDLQAMLSMPWFLDVVHLMISRRAPVLRQVIVGGERVITAAMQAAEELSEGLWTVDSEDGSQDCKSHHQEASKCESTDFVRDHEGMGVQISCRCGGCPSISHAPWSDSRGPGLLTVQDAEPSKSVTVIVDEDAVEERPAGWLIVAFLGFASLLL